MTDRPRGASLPVVLFNLFLAAGSWAVAVALLLRGTTGAYVAAALVAALAVVLTLGVVANLAMRRFPAGLPAPVADRWEGEAAVRVPSWGFAAAITPVITALAGVAGTLLGLGALLSGRVFFGIFALPAGLYLLWLTGLFLVGRIPLRQGVWLTPTRVVVRQSGTTAQIGWDDLAPLSGAGSRTLLTSRGTAVRTSRTDLLGVRRQTEGTEVVVEHGRLGVPPEGLVAVATRLVDDPSARQLLGSEEGVRLVRAEAYDALGGRHPASLHPARQR